ncbi:MAG: cell division protein SepF [Butyrivibrio sp.]|nr:cell division protein SepF [Butyrivibrio sp.]
MNVMDKFLNAMKLSQDDDDYYTSEGDYDESEEPVHKMAPVSSGADADSERSKSVLPRPMPATKTRRSVMNSGMEVCVIKPTSVEEGREITETLLANRTVVLNLEGLDVEIAQRIIDFTSGSTFAISGNLQKISKYIFIITPPSVDISGDFQDILHGMSGNGDGPFQM